MAFASRHSRASGNPVRRPGFRVSASLRPEWRWEVVRIRFMPAPFHTCPTRHSRESGNPELRQGILGRNHSSMTCSELETAMGSPVSVAGEGRHGDSHGRSERSTGLHVEQTGIQILDIELARLVLDDEQSAVGQWRGKGQFPRHAFG